MELATKALTSSQPGFSCANSIQRPPAGPVQVFPVVGTCQVMLWTLGAWHEMLKNVW